MSEHILIGLGSIIVLGILAQWLAWRLHLPAILLLLVAGFLAGPATGILHPDEVFGDLFFPIVSVSVAIILFEGGLSLKFRELKQGGGAVLRLTTVGILVTWVLASLGGYYIAGMDLPIAVLLGAVLVVTGPTVIIPLLRQVRPIGKSGSVAKWEGIVNDPIGAILAVLVFELILSGEGQGSSVVIWAAVKSLAFGGLIGLAGAGITVLFLRRYLVPDFLQSPVATMLVVMAYIASNSIQPESGLLAVTVMGIALANQRFVSIKHIYEFKENLRVLLISSLFIMLAARLPVKELGLTNWGEWAFIALLIVVVRPASIFISTIGSDLKRAEKIFLAALAPRGIVAAAVVSVFAIRLQETHFVGVADMVPLTFKIIFTTVAVYGLALPYIARALKVAKPNPQGVLFAGAAPWVRKIGEVLKNEGFQVAFVDANWANVTAARNEGFRAYYGSVLSEELLNELQLDDIGKMISVTPNDEVNSLASLHFVDIFGRSGVFQLPPAALRRNTGKNVMPLHLRGRYAFREDTTFAYFRDRFNAGAVVKRTTLTEEFDMDRLTLMYGEGTVPLFAISESNVLGVYSVENPPAPNEGDRVISLVDPRE